MRQVRRGTFAHLEDPDKGLRYDKIVRNLNIYTFTELRGLNLKAIMRCFREPAERLLDAEVLERWELTRDLQRQEESLIMKEIISTTGGQQSEILR